MSTRPLNPRIVFAMWTGAYAIAIAIFWLLRAVYWSSVSEIPFSDMADYISIANGLLREGSFAAGDFWRTYKPPIVPLMMAISSFAYGAVDLDSWRIFQALFLFASLVWLARELVIATASRWTGFALIACVALCRPSVFWSYKAATESVAEGFVYLLLAAWLAFARKGTWRWALALGIACMFATLARPNFAIAIGLFGVAVALRAFASHARPARRTAVIGAFAAGVLVVWTPWIVRNHSLYGGLLLATTQGPYSFLWELGEVSVTLPDGKRFTSDVNRMQEEAPRLFRNDYEASRFASQVAWGWLKENPGLYLRMIRARLWHQISNRTEHLTKLPREHLFPNLREPLIDKRGVAVLAGFLGLGLFAVARGARFLPLVLLPALFWIFSALFIGYSRMFDPLVAVSLFGIALLVPSLPPWWRVLRD